MKTGEILKNCGSISKMGILTLSKKSHEKKGIFFEKLVLGASSFGGDIIESKNKQYALFHPSVSRKTLSLIKNNKVIWKKEFDNLVSFDLANDGSYVVVTTQLTEKEYGKKSYKSGGHIYLVNRSGKILLDRRTPGDGLSCSISPDNKLFGVTTMGPEWGVYYFDNQGKLVWNKRFNKSVGGIEVTNMDIILYDKMHKPTRKKCSYWRI